LNDRTPFPDVVSDVENITDALRWWYERQAAFPHLSHMAWDYLSISGGFSQHHFVILSVMIILVATTIEVELTFSQGRLILLHVCNCLSSQSIYALMCVGNWSQLGPGEILLVLGDELNEDEDELLAGWDQICL
jgi:hypothetical protein